MCDEQNTGVQSVTSIQRDDPKYVLSNVVKEVERTIALYVDYVSNHGHGYFEPVRLLFCWYDFLGKLYSGKADGARSSITAWLRSEPMQRRNKLYSEMAEDLYYSCRNFLVHAGHPPIGVFSYEDEEIPYTDGSPVRNLERSEDGKPYYYIPPLLHDLKEAIQDYLHHLEGQEQDSMEDGPGTRCAFARGLRLAQTWIVKLTHDTNRIVCVRQKGDNWCIPAGIEFAVRFVGIKDVTQEQLVLKFCRKEQDSDKPPLKGGDKTLSKLGDNEVIELAKSSAFNATFGHFITALEAVSSGALNAAGYRFDTEGNPAKVERLLLDTLKRGLPFLISIPGKYLRSISADAHIMPVLEFNKESGQILLWEPISEKRIKLKLREIIDDLSKSQQSLDCAYLAKL